MSLPEYFDRDKFRELILYVVREGGEEGFGDTHLNKVLFFSDAFALQHLGRSITGARYQKLKYGPAPRALLPVRNEMESEGAIAVKKVSGSWTRTLAKRDADTSLFDKDELDIVNQVIEIFRGKWASEVSELSHLNSPGWNLVEMGDDVPLESQFISQDTPPPEALARGRELAARFGW